MGAPLTFDVFQPRVGESFRIASEGGEPVDVVLAECEELSSTGPKTSTRRPFRLLFVGPVAPWLPQHMYKVLHEQLEAMSIFLVPIGPDARGMRYEAIFT